MKKSLLFSFMVAGLVMMSSCTKEKVIVIGGDDSNAAQQIVLQVANTGDGLQTRAGRPLYSSEAKQTIENVKVIICKGNAVKYVKTVENWNTSSSEYTTGGHGRMTTIEIPKDERLNEDGEYTVYAFGYHAGTDYENLRTAIAEIATGTRFNPNTILNIKAGVKGEEIFAGSITFELKKEIGFKRPVVLNRQVAGTFGYFEAVPYFEGATKLQLVAPQRNTNLVLGEFANFDLLSNGKDENDDHINFVVNGTEKASDNVIYEIELSEWFNALKDDNKDGLIDYDAANWKNPYTGNANFKTGSVFGGTFLIPFAKVGEEKTFVLKLTDNANHEYATWTVKLPTTDKQTVEYTLKSWGTDSFVSASCTDITTTYNVVRNHLYGIGERALDNPENPDKPTPDPSNPDKPEPLNKKQELTLRVNDNWEVIHKMEIEQD